MLLGLFNNFFFEKLQQEKKISDLSLLLEDMNRQKMHYVSKVVELENTRFNNSSAGSKVIVNPEMKVKIGHNASTTTSVGRRTKSKLKLGNSGWFSAIPLLGRLYHSSVQPIPEYIV